MIFRPVQPHICCWGYVNMQGVFLKRQPEVSKQLTKMICDHLVNTRRFLEYIVRRQDVAERILEIFQRHAHGAIDGIIDETLGRAKRMAPRFVGQGAIDGIKEEVVKEALEVLPQHSREIEDYMDNVFNLQDTLGSRLSGLHPEQFEQMLHPVFQEDEWMVLLLGGILGVIVGTIQAFAL